MKIKNDFFDIFEENFSLEEEREIVERIAGKFVRDWQEWTEANE